MILESCWGMFDDIFAESGFSLDRCRAFLTIAKAGGITQAASGSASRQSQLSRQLGELEGWLGVKLIVRGRGRFALTEAGKQLSALLNAHFTDLTRLKASCSGGTQTVRIGAGESLLQWLVIPALSMASKELPPINWHFKNLRTEQVVSGLLGGELELGVIRRKDVPKGLKTEALGKINYAFIIPNTLNAQMSSGKPPSNLPIAVLEGESHIDHLLTRLPSPFLGCLQRRFVCTSMAQAAETVRLGAAAAILPETVIAHLPKNFATLVPLGLQADASIALSMVWLPGISRVWPRFDSCLKHIERALARQASA